MFDLFKCAGPRLADGGRRPAGPGAARTGARRRAGRAPCARPTASPIEAQRGFDDVPAPTVVCVPELMIAPYEPLDGLLRPGGRLGAPLPRRRRAGRHRLLGRHAAGRGRPARRRGRDHALGLLRHAAAPLPARARAAAARAGHLRRRPAPGDGRRRQFMDGPGALPDRALCRHRGRDAGRQAQPDRLAPRGPAALRARGAHAAGGGRGDRPLPDLDRRPLRARRRRWPR